MEKDTSHSTTSSDELENQQTESHSTVNATTSQVYKNVTVVPKTYFIASSNGLKMIESALDGMGWSRIWDRRNPTWNLRWVPSVRCVAFDDFKLGRQLVNAIPNCSLLTNKLGLIDSLQTYGRICNGLGMSTRNHIPIETFIPETYRLADASDREMIKKVYRENEVWICKPTGSNQGRGIFLIRSMSELLHQIEDSEAKEKQWRKKGYKMVSQRIVQRYLEPLLLDGRKFDIRAYMIIASTKPWLVYYHKGYIRLSSAEYKADDADMKIHLTNQYIQKKDPDYEAIKEDTVWSMDKFNDYINNLEAAKHLERNWVYRGLTTRMRQIMLQCFESVQHRLGSNVGYFGLYGLDFMVDSNFQVWLIEVNMNPSLATNCSAQREILPDLIKETLELAVECFEKSRKQQVLCPVEKVVESQLLVNFCPRARVKRAALFYQGPELPAPQLIDAQRWAEYYRSRSKSRPRSEKEKEDTSQKSDKTKLLKEETSQKSEKPKQLNGKLWGRRSLDPESWYTQNCNEKRVPEKPPSLRYTSSPNRTGNNDKPSNSRLSNKDSRNSNHGSPLSIIDSRISNHCSRVSSPDSSILGPKRVSNENLNVRKTEFEEDNEDDSVHTRLAPDNRNDKTWNHYSEITKDSNINSQSSALPPNSDVTSGSTNDQIITPTGSSPSHAINRNSRVTDRLKWDASSHTYLPAERGPSWSALDPKLSSAIELVRKHMTSTAVASDFEYQKRPLNDNAALEQAIVGETHLKIAGLERSPTLVLYKRVNRTKSNNRLIYSDNNLINPARGSQVKQSARGSKSEDQSGSKVNKAEMTYTQLSGPGEVSSQRQRLEELGKLVQLTHVSNLNRTTSIDSLVSARYSSPINPNINNNNNNRKRFSVNVNINKDTSAGLNNPEYVNNDSDIPHQVNNNDISMVNYNNSNNPTFHSIKPDVRFFKATQKTNRPNLTNRSLNDEEYIVEKPIMNTRISLDGNELILKRLIDERKRQSINQRMHHARRFKLSFGQSDREKNTGNADRDKENMVVRSERTRTIDEDESSPHSRVLSAGKTIVLSERDRKQIELVHEGNLRYYQPPAGGREMNKKTDYSQNVRLNAIVTSASADLLESNPPTRGRMIADQRRKLARKNVENKLWTVSSQDTDNVDRLTQSKQRGTGVVSCDNNDECDTFISSNNDSTDAERQRGILHEQINPVIKREISVPRITVHATN